MTTDAFLCAPGFETALLREAGRGAVAPVPGVVVAPRGERGIADLDHVFARQVLPEAIEVRAPSVKRLADAAFDALLPRLDGEPDGWRLHTLVPDDPTDPNLPGELRRRADLVGEAFLAVAKSRRRRVHRRRDEAGALLVQLLLVARETLFASLARPGPLPRGGLWPGPFPAGIAPVPEDRTAPSRAYRKLDEALLWLGRGIREGDRVVDLGAAPGGWTWAALRSGAASVTAVDRADLDPALVADPRVVHEARTAFSFEPANPPVDWLLCDVIAYPERSLELLDTWIRNAWASNLVFHLKFKGREDYGPAFRARALLLESDHATIRVKHLYHDRNEVTAFAAAEDRAAEG